MNVAVQLPDMTADFEEVGRIEGTEQSCPRDECDADEGSVVAIWDDGSAELTREPDRIACLDCNTVHKWPEGGAS